MSSKTQVVIFDGKISKNVFIKKSDLQVEGQTSGEWIALGKFNLPKGRKASVIVTNKDVDGNIAADAILFNPVK